MGSRDWTDWGRLFDCDDTGEPYDCDPGSGDPRDDDDGFHSGFVAEFVRLWSHRGGWVELDAVEEAHALFDRVFLLDELKGALPQDFERGEPAGEARRAYLDWVRADESLEDDEEDAQGPLPERAPPSRRGYEEAGELDDEGDEHEGRSLTALGNEVGDAAEDLPFDRNEFDLSGGELSDCVEYDVDEWGVVDYGVEANGATPGPADEHNGEHSALIEAHARQWIGARLSTGAADRAAFERAAGRSYAYAGIPWHGNVIWVGSPAALVLAAKITSELRRYGFEYVGEGYMQDALLDLTGGEVVSAVDEALRVAAAGRRPSRLPRHIRWFSGIAHTTQYTVDEIIEKRVLEPARDAIERLAGLEPYRGADALLSAVDEAVVRAGALVLAAVTAAEAAVAERAPAWGPPGLLVMQGLRRLRQPYSGALLRDASPCQPEVSSYFREVRGVAFPPELQAHTVAREQMLQSGCWWYAHWDFLMACEPPCEIHQERVVRGGRSWNTLHRLDGPAISFPNGWAVHAIHGRSVPAWLIEHPERITPDSIAGESNAEVRRAMIERYGWSQYMADCGAEVIDEAGEDHPLEGLRGARLLRKELPGEPEPLVYLEMRNSTQDPDGTRRRYLERIDPNAYDGDAGRLCHAAMASRWRHVDDQGQLRLTFERWLDYQPTRES